MKKQNEIKNEQVTEVKEKKMRQKRKFFLYADGKGFITSGDGSGLPTFNGAELLVFETKAKAVFARDFFLKLKLADSIDILAKVA